MNSIVERLLRKNEDGSLGEITEADQYEAAERIKELEAERDLHKRSCEALVEANKNLNQTLSALRQRIADAPVVAWMLYGEAYSVKQRDVFTKIELPNQYPLISKKDLL